MRVISMSLRYVLGVQTNTSYGFGASRRLLYFHMIKINQLYKES